MSWPGKNVSLRKCLLMKGDYFLCLCVSHVLLSVAFVWFTFDLNLIQEMNELNISLFSGLVVRLSCCACRSYMWRKCRGTRWTCCWWTRQICWPGSRGERGPNTLRKTGWGPFSGRPWLRATGWKQRRRWGDGDLMSVNASMVNVWNLKWFLNTSVWRVIIM